MIKKFKETNHLIDEELELLEKEISEWFKTEDDENIIKTIQFIEQMFNEQIEGEKFKCIKIILIICTLTGTDFNCYINKKIC